MGLILKYKDIFAWMFLYQRLMSSNVIELKSNTSIYYKIAIIN